jgi:hypothetical protein
MALKKGREREWKESSCKGRLQAKAWELASHTLIKFCT